MRVIALFVSVVVLALSNISVSYAHNLKADNTIGALIHIDPDDAPVTNTPATFFFEVKDKNNQFTGDGCICNIRIFQQDNEIASMPLLRQSDTMTTISASYVFTTPGAYTLKVSGAPTIENAFQSFNLSYDIRVESGSDTKGVSSETIIHSIHYGGIGLATLYVVWFIMRENRREAMKKRGEKI